MSDLRQRIADLSPDKRALLELRLMQRGGTVSGNQVIPRRAVAGPYPLSFAQQRLWFLHQFEPVSPVYNMPKAVRLRGALNVGALQRSLNVLVARHEVLRTTFAAVDGNPVQVIAEGRPLELPVSDGLEWPMERREAEVQRWLAHETRRPFDLSRDWPLRAALLQLDVAEHVLLLTTHHIASDAWSTGVLISELAALYDAFAADRPSPLPELPIQYADYAVWQRNWLQGEVLETQLAYWRQQLAGPLPVLQLPTDRPRPAVLTYPGAKQALRLPQPVSEALKALSRQAGVTLFMTLLAAFQTLLHRYTGQDDILVGSPIAGRTRVEMETLIGFFVNTLVLRTDLSGDPPYRELLGRVREVALGAYAHQDLPFERLVEELQPTRSLSHSPLFQVMFVLQNAPRQPFELPGLTLTPLEVESGAAKFELTLFMWEEAGGLACSLEYNTDLFDPATIARMLGHWQTLLEGIVADPDRRLSQLPLLTAAERRQLLVDWNATQEGYPDEACLHELFEAQVERTPEAVALVYDDQRLTYRELNTRANQLAHRLRALGVGPEVMVGLCLERSVELVVGLLGILKAGGAYVPLDPTYPKERLAFMLEEIQAPVLLTQQQLIKALPDQAAMLLCLDAEWQIVAQESEANPQSRVKPDNLAYVIYTSGSTGQPKGAMILHRGLVNYLSWCTRAYAVAEGCGAPVHSPIGFDLTVTSLFSPLLVGQSVVLLAEEQGIDALAATLCSRSDFSLVKITPAHLEVLSRLLPTEEAARQTRALIIGGEALWGESLSFWRAHAPDMRIINEYGPTETVVGCCVYEVPVGNSISGAVPIGRPIANTQLYVLDSRLQPVPRGVPGELYIGGVGLARGYLKRPELTADKFIANPFSTEPGTRLYKTGDLARYLPDGHIEFLGRTDDQLKLRGFRIELGEIEATLTQSPEVREAVVVAREEKPGDKRLVAYVVPAPGQVPTSAGLRTFLQEKLPHYMVPSAFVTLEALPLTPNGKVDRRALPAPDGIRPELEAAYIAPRTATETVVAGIWADILGLEQVGVQDNFFELGGHSLLATQVISRLYDAFKVSIPLRHLFEAPTVAGLIAVMLRNPSEQARIEKRAALLLRLAQLSEDEAETLLMERVSSLKEKEGT